MFGTLDSSILEDPEGETKSTKSKEILEKNLTQTERRERLFVRLDLISLQATELNTERQEMRLKENNFLSGIQSLDLSLTDNLRIDLKIPLQR